MVDVEWLQSCFSLSSNWASFLILRLADCPVGYKRNKRFKFKTSLCFSPFWAYFRCYSSAISLLAYRFTLMALDMWLVVTLHPPSLVFPTEAGWLSCTQPNIHTASNSKQAQFLLWEVISRAVKRARLSAIVFGETEVKPKVSRQVFGVLYSLKTHVLFVCFLFLFFFENWQKIIWSFHRAKQKFLRQILFILEIHYSKVITHISTIWEFHLYGQCISVTPPNPPPPRSRSMSPSQCNVLYLVYFAQYWVQLVHPYTLGCGHPLEPLQKAQH